jgi:uncharacterized protein (TIGR02246 family)
MTRHGVLAAARMLTSSWVLASCVLAVPIAIAATADDVETAVQAWADAYNSHEPERVVARYHPEAAFWGTTSPTLRTTPTDVAAYFAGLARRPNARVSIGEKTVRIVGSVAIVTGTYTFTDRVDGEDVTRPARFSFVLEQTGDDWLLVQHHSSRMPD